MLFLKQCIILKHTWARGKERVKGERRERVSRSYSALVPVSWMSCIFYNLIVNQWVSSPHVTIKNQQIEKRKPLFFSAVINPFRSGFVCDILLFKNFFFIIKILGTLWGKYQVLGRGGKENIMEKGINPRLFAFSSRPLLGINKTKTETSFWTHVGHYLKDCCLVCTGEGGWKSDH